MCDLLVLSEVVLPEVYTRIVVGGPTGVKGADFQMLALEHCRSVLDETTRDQTEDMTQSLPVQLLSDCVEYHQQLIDASHCW